METRREFVKKAATVAALPLVANMSASAEETSPSIKNNPDPVLTSRGTVAGYFLRLADDVLEHKVVDLVDLSTEVPGDVAYGYTSGGDYVYQETIQINTPYVIEKVTVRDAMGGLLTEVISPSPSSSISWSFAVASIADTNRRMLVAAMGQMQRSISIKIVPTKATPGTSGTATISNTQGGKDRGFPTCLGSTENHTSSATESFGTEVVDNCAGNTLKTVKKTFRVGREYEALPQNATTALVCMPQPVPPETLGFKNQYSEYTISSHKNDKIKWEQQVSHGERHMSVGFKDLKGNLVGSLKEYIIKYIDRAPGIASFVSGTRCPETDPAQD